MIEATKPPPVYALDSVYEGIPQLTMFEGEEFIEAGDLAAMARSLISKYPADLEHLTKVKIEFLWREKGGMRSGDVLYGDCVRTAALARFYSHMEFTIWLSANDARASRLSRDDVEALLYHQLMHIEWDNDKERARIRGHQFAGFESEIAHFGFRDLAARKMARAFHARFEAGDALQLSLLDAADAKAATTEAEPPAAYGEDESTEPAAADDAQAPPSDAGEASEAPPEEPPEEPPAK